MRKEINCSEFVNEFVDKMNICKRMKTHIKRTLTYLGIKEEKDILKLDERTILFQPDFGIKTYDEILRVWVHEYNHCIYHTCEDRFKFSKNRWIDRIEFRW